MKGTDDLMGGTMVASVGFQIQPVTNENTLYGAFVNLRVMLVLNEHKSPATNLPKMREIGLASIPHLEWGDTQGKRVGGCMDR